MTPRDQVAPPADRATCEALDGADPLAPLRERFWLPDGEIYLDGNSLGPLPRETPERLAHAIRHDWGERLIRSWNEAGWFDLPVSLGERIGALIGAAAGQTVVCDTVSINLYKALHAAMALRPERDVIVAEAGSFPTDLYMIEGAMRSAVRPFALRLLGRDGDRLEALLDRRVAVVVLSHVDYRTGALLDAGAATRLAHRAGALVIWDVCHSAGVVPIAFDGDCMDFAVGCTYKYLCAGPGAPAFLTVAGKHLGDAQQPLSGWWGHASPFAFERSFRSDSGIRRFLCGTQPILSMLGVASALDAFEGFGVAALRQKSLALTALFIARVGALLPDLRVLTPRDPGLRGSQVSLAFPHAFAVIQALIARGIIGDFRAPDVMRFGIAPSFLRYQDIWDATEALAACLRSEEWRGQQFSVRGAVT